MKRYNEKIQEQISKEYNRGMRYLVGKYDRENDTYYVFAAFQNIEDAKVYVAECCLEILENYD